MNEIVTYQAGAKEIELTPKVIRQYLVAGNGSVSDSEVMMFMKMCEFQGLNPYLREAYLVKYGDYPATMITGKETFVKRASRNPHYRGHKVGMSDDAKSAWAEVHHEKLDFPIRVEVDYDEYVGMKNGVPNKMWKSKPKTMLKKVALVQALRETFPEEFGGLYSPEEIHDVDESLLPTDEVIIVEADNVKQLDHTETGVQQAASKDKTDKTDTPETSESSEIPNEIPLEEEKKETPADDKQSDTAFVKIKKVTKKKNAADKIQFFIFSVGETMYSTFDEKVATAADKIKGKDIEALIAYDIVVVGDNTYFNVSKGEVDAVFIIQS